MKLILITPDQPMMDEPTMLNSMFGMGLERLHIRKPDFTAEDIRHYIGQIDEGYHPRLVLCNHFELAREYRVGGIHLNSKFRSDSHLLSLIADVPPPARSTSFHSWQEVLENEYSYGYVFISPVFDSISKSGYMAAINLDGANNVTSILSQSGRYCPEIIGLGGVGSAQLRILRDYGFDGAAMLGSIWMAEDPVSKLREAIAVITQL